MKNGNNARTVAPVIIMARDQMAFDKPSTWDVTVSSTVLHQVSITSSRGSRRATSISRRYSGTAFKNLGSTIQLFSALGEKISSMTDGNMKFQRLSSVASINLTDKLGSRQPFHLAQPSNRRYAEGIRRTKELLYGKNENNLFIIHYNYQ